MSRAFTRMRPLLAAVRSLRVSGLLPHPATRSKANTRSLGRQSALGYMESDMRSYTTFGSRALLSTNVTSVRSDMRTRSSGAVPRRGMFIQTSDTPNPDSRKFHPDSPVLVDGGSLDFASKEMAKKSPLARKLFSIDGVKNVFLTRTYIAINKEPSVTWTELDTFIYGTIEDFYASGQPVVAGAAAASDTAINDSDSEAVQMIKELLETRIRPTVQDDGGDIQFMGFDEDEGVVYLKMQGSCSGCPSSSVTLKNGIEGMLMHYVPEVYEVREVFDEEAALSLEEFQKTEAKLAEMRAKAAQS